MSDEEMAKLKAGHVYQMSVVYASYIITVEEERGRHSEGRAAERGAQLWLSAQRKQQHWWRGGSLQRVSASSGQ